MFRFKEIRALNSLMMSLCTFCWHGHISFHLCPAAQTDDGNCTTSFSQCSEITTKIWCLLSTFRGFFGPSLNMTLPMHSAPYKRQADQPEEPDFHRLRPTQQLPTLRLKPLVLTLQHEGLHWDSVSAACGSHLRHPGARSAR